MTKRTPLSVAEIEAQLDEVLEVEFSFLKIDKPAQVIAGLDRPDQDFMLSWVRRVASTNIQLAYQFITQAVEALDRLDKAVIESWALHAMDLYDQSGLYPAMEVIRNVEHFVALSHQRQYGAVFEENAGVLMHFVHGLSGRQLKLQQGEAAYTNSETLFLPAIVAPLANREDNFLLYKAMVAHLWAQTRFGTFRVRLSEALQDQAQPDKFIALFHALETLRLEACIARELPGLHRGVARIKQALGEDRRPAVWRTLASDLAAPGISAHDVLNLTRENIGVLAPPSPFAYQGEIRHEQVEACMDARLEKEKAAFRHVLLRMAEDAKRTEEKAGKSAEPSERKFSTQRTPDPSQPEGYRIEIVLDDKPVAPPEEAADLMSSIILDLGEIPDDYLVPAGPGEYDPNLFQEQESDPDDVWKGTYHEEGAFLYDEWDCRRQHYRKSWCAVREKTITPVYDDFVQKTIQKYSGLIRHLHKTFEALRDENRLLKRQPDGEDVDIDALVEALADARDGSEMTDRLFTRMHRTDRNIAVLFMVDMSGSTKGWINDAERESLILLCEALESLGDRYAIYGFSGMARKRCEIYKIKEFDQPYNDETKACISGIRPQDYTRMGFAIRHLSRILNDADARTRVLVTLSDGKPDDYDNYRGEYGIEDTRRALIEARRSGIHPFCITIDAEGHEYLPHMYGPVNYTLVDDVRKLPFKVSDIYRKLTT